MPIAVLLMPFRAEKCILVVQEHWQKGYKAVCESRSCITTTYLLIHQKFK